MDGLLVLGIILLFLGFIFVGIEMLIPGFGLHGILGTVCLIAGVFVVSRSILEAVIVVTIILGVLAVMFGIIMYLLSKGKLNSPIILQEKQQKEDGYISADNLNYLLGKTGTAATDLRPSGKGIFEQTEFDVISDGYFVPKGSEIEICKVSNAKVVVKQVS